MTFEHDDEAHALVERRKVLIHPEQAELREVAKSQGMIPVPEVPTPEPGTPLSEAALRAGIALMKSGGIRVASPVRRGTRGGARRTGAPKPKPEHGIGHLDARAAELLHHPCVRLDQTYQSRYIERRGDLMLRTYVVRYAHLFAGFPMWHCAGVVLGADNAPKPREEWSRRDRRQMAQLLERRLENAGDGPALTGEAAGMFNEYAMHRLRPLSEAEARHYPAELLQKHEPIDLTEEAEDGGVARDDAGDTGGGKPEPREAGAPVSFP